MTSLGRFISKLGERALIFFKLVKKNVPFEWIPEAEAAFEDLKRYLTSPPVMVAPTHPKVLLTLLIASRKLHHYFQGHPIKVILAYPLEKVLHSPNGVGRVAEWNIELQVFQLEFITTRVFKGAALADFGSGARVMFVSPTKDKLYYAVQLCFQRGEKVSNNTSEYEGLIASLRAAAGLGIKRLTIKGDSQLLANFSNKEYKPKDKHMEAYMEEEDDIAKRASRREPQRPDVFEERLHKPSAAPLAMGLALLREELPPAPTSGAPACGSTLGAHLLLALEPQAGCWIEEFKAYLLHDTLREKEEDTERVVRQCISEGQGCKLLADIHGEDRGHHSSSRTLVGKVFCSGFYWPTVLNDAAKLVQSGEACQFHA
ncbi:uncharacterized protein [Aegilops tauschii subsp. strangulata]|uniref:uncharacterized protein n=1 Tax=Aegilops tauschii subsp. strangulata TaxID=200361 RepID=UPI00098AED29|nr:uncharacterized protein LOC109778749 [Aegilops tauschii subsp. strangulata]